MRTIQNTLVVLAGVFLLNACGNSGPAETAEEFVTLISEAKLDEAKKIADKITQNNIDYLANRCIWEERDRLSDSVVNIAKSVLDMRRNGKDKGAMNKALKEFRKEYTEKDSEQFTKELVAKYGSFGKLSQKKREEILFEGFRKFEKPASKLAETLIEISGIEPENREEVQKALAYYILGTDAYLTPNYGRRRLLKKIAYRAVLDRGDKPSPECMETQSQFGMIDDVNIIETKFESSDVARIRLELVREDGRSRKETVDVEKIQGEWKISNMRLDP